MVGLLVGTLLVGPPFLAAVFGLGLGMARLGLDATGIFSASFTAIAVLVLVLSLSSVISALFADRTLLLLALAPVGPGSVFVAKLIGASLPAWGTGSLLYAELAGFGMGSGVHISFYLLAALGLASIVFATVALQVIVLSLALRLAPVDRARDLSNMLAGLLGVLVYISWYLVSSRGWEFGFQGVQQLAGAGDRLGWLPTTWPARALAELAAHHTSQAGIWFGLTTLAVAILLGGAWVAYRQAFLVGVGVYGEGGARIGRRTYRMVHFAEGPADPAGAIRRKDLLALRRDMRRLASVLPSVAVAIVYPILLTRTTGLLQPGQTAAWIQTLGSLFAPFLLSNVLALPAVPLEGRGIKLLLLTGTPPWVVLRAKLGYAVPAVSGLGVLAAVAVASFNGAAPAQLVLVGVAAAWFGSGLAAIAVGAGAIAPNFETTNPRRAVRFEGSLLALAGEAVFAGLSAGALLLPVGASALPPPLGPLTAALAPALAVLAVGVVAVILAMGAGSLARLQADPR
jgi:ABC-2 type transport system permease protein